MNSKKIYTVIDGQEIAAHILWLCPSKIECSNSWSMLAAKSIYYS